MSDNDHDALPSEDLVGIVIRARRLGFNATRVATALGVSAEGLASIEQRMADSAQGRDAHGGGSTTANSRHFG